ncbi:MAG: hypothetical protein H7Z74_04190 [Anaerolineae bacterium]|nr:hypothetical protein [Gemmatimonadaceae bacterium]
MKHLTEEQLNDLADDAIPARVGPEHERHIAECLTCRAEIARIRSLAKRIGALPLSIQPPAETWPMISARIRNSAPIPDQERSVLSRRPPAWSWLAAAAVLLVVVSSAVTTLVVRRPDVEVPATVASRPATDNDRNLAALSSREEGFRNTADELWAAVNARRDQLSPETIATVERSIKLIDAAILEAREALASDPNNAVIADMLAARYERKVDLLKRATELLPQS